MNISGVVQKYERLAASLESGKVSASAHADLAADASANLHGIALQALLDSGEVSEENTDRAHQFVDTFAAHIAHTSSRYTLSIPDLSDHPTTPAREDIEEWVRQGYESGSQDNRDGKVFDARDTDVESTVARMQYILLGSPVGQRAAAQQKYLPLVTEFMARGITDALIDRWGAIVLTAWVKYVRDSALAYGVRALRRELKAT